MPSRAWTTFQCQLFLVHQLSLSTVSCQLHYCCCIWAMLMPHFRSYCAGEQLNNVRNLLLFLLVRHCVYFPLSPPQPHSMNIIIEPPIRVETECSSTRNLPYFALLWLSCCYCPLCVCGCVCLGVEECVTKCRKICRRSVSPRRWKLFFIISFLFFRFVLFTLVLLLCWLSVLWDTFSLEFAC